MKRFNEQRFLEHLSAEIDLATKKSQVSHRDVHNRNAGAAEALTALRTKILKGEFTDRTVKVKTPTGAKLEQVAIVPQSTF